MTFAVPPPLPRDIGTYCQACQASGPTKYVRFYQHIGAVILMFNQHINGHLCRKCLNSQFAKTTLITSFLGWWGMISCLLTPFFLFNNVIRYLTCLSLKPASDEFGGGGGSGANTVFAFAALGIAASLLGLLLFLLISIIWS